MRGSNIYVKRAKSIKYIKDKMDTDDFIRHVIYGIIIEFYRDY